MAISFCRVGQCLLVENEMIIRHYRLAYLVELRYTSENQEEKFFFPFDNVGRVGLQVVFFSIDGELLKAI